MRRTLAIAALLVGLGCGPAGAQEIGKGELWIHQSVMDFYKEFQNRFGSSYFAVSTNGYSAGYSYCPGMRCKQQQIKQIAIRGCAEAGGNQGGQCFIFGTPSRILWQGEVHVLPD